MTLEGAVATNACGSGITAGAVFDRMAAEYDQRFTRSLIGRAQREAVWEVLRSTFHAGDNVLEMNCGTGEDAIFLAGRGVSVFACDASEQMIATAEQRLQGERAALPVVFCQLPTERLQELQPAQRFDGAFSNFSGLNCVADLKQVAASLALLLKDGGRLVLCFSTRFCVAEMLHYACRGTWAKALRRCRGTSVATLEAMELPVFYPTVREIRRCFSAHFRLLSLRGVGVAVPPSYLEPWVRRHPRTFDLLCRLEGSLAGFPLLRSTGDHVLLSFEKVTS